MDINEMTLREVMERGLTWEDFGDRKEILKPIMFEAYETNEITEAYRIACYLDEKMEKIVFRCQVRCTPAASTLSSPRISHAWTSLKAKRLKGSEAKEPCATSLTIRTWIS